jgi:hypothetical protein
VLELICWLAGIAAVAGCLSGSALGPERFVRDPARPWVLLGSHGSVKVDTTHPEWQKSFRKQLRDIERMRASLNTSGQ